jgi:uncharacterized protein YbjT (DUF2867 family)
MTPAPSVQAAPTVHVIGATGRTGLALCRRLRAEGIAFVPVVRSGERWAALGMRIEPRVADLRDEAALRSALAGATRIVSCAHARFVPEILAAAPPSARLVLLGSTRKFSRWPDEHGSAVLAGERAFLASGRAGVMLHPTMIYGAEGEANVQPLAALLRRLPLVPLPKGGRALVQPIHQDDVTRCICAALERDWTGPSTLVIAGPEAMRYADFVRAIAAAAGLRRRPIVSVPAWLLMALARVAAIVPGLPRIEADAIRRLLEDKAFDIAEMRRLLRIDPISFGTGLQRTFDGHSPRRSRNPAS